MKFIKKYNLLLLTLLSGLVVSCELSPENPNDYQDDEVAQANLFAVGMYHAYRKVIANEFHCTELRSDNAISENGDGDIGNSDTYNITAEYGEGSDYWANNYSVVLNANLILIKENDLAGDVDGEKALAEAYFMRALCHFNMVRTFKRVPFINAVIGSTDDVTNFPQQEENDMYNFIINDFEKSIQYFLSSGYTGVKNKASLGAAYGLLAKAYMSPNEDEGGVKNYAAAYSILSGYLAPDTNIFGYELLDDCTQVHSLSNELNEEVLFAISYEDDAIAVTSDIGFEDQVQGQAQDFTYEMSENGKGNGIILSNEFIALVQAITVVDPVDGSSSIYVPEPVRGIEADGIISGSDVSLFRREIGHYYDDKHVSEQVSGAETDGNANDETSPNDWIVLRYSDVLLLFSEAILAGGTSTTDIEAIKMYNMVRARASASTIAEDGTGVLTKDDLLTERRIELVFENHRLWDLIRFGDARAVLSVHSPTFETGEQFLPIPQREIDATGGKDVTYQQNVGYN